MDPETYFEELDHHDSGPEEVFVVSGIFNDGVRDYPAGTFIHAPKGFSHVSRSTTGCTLSSCSTLTAGARCAPVATQASRFPGRGNSGQVGLADRAGMDGINWFARHGNTLPHAICGPSRCRKQVREVTQPKHTVRRGPSAAVWSEMTRSTPAQAHVR